MTVSESVGDHHGRMERESERMLRKKSVPVLLEKAVKGPLRRARMP